MLIIIALSVGLMTRAQLVQPIEGEASVGFTLPMTGFHHGEKAGGVEAGLELRYNVPGTPWDCGVLFDVTTAVYKFDFFPMTDWWSEQSNRSTCFMLVGDYNFRQGEIINPYVGAGLGISFYDAVSDVEFPVSGTTAVFRPRAGIELLRHIRVGVFANITRAGHSNFGFSIGGVIGGRPR